VQLVQLQLSSKELKRLGYGVAAISYDSRAILDDFAKRKHIDYPLISDAGSIWLTSAGLMNTEATGMLQGTSKPATLVMDSKGTIVRVIQEEAYQSRWTLAMVTEQLEAPSHKRAVSPKEITWSQSQSDREVSEGNIFELSHG
jgi:peroxiredoxin